MFFCLAGLKKKKVNLYQWKKKSLEYEKGGSQKEKNFHFPNSTKKKIKVNFPNSFEKKIISFSKLDGKKWIQMSFIPKLMIEKRRRWSMKDGEGKEQKLWEDGVTCPLRAEVKIALGQCRSWREGYLVRRCSGGSSNGRDILKTMYTNANRKTV